jgi:hypothetical protein
MAMSKAAIKAATQINAPIMVREPSNIPERDQWHR